MCAMAQIASERAMVAASQLEKIGFVDFTVDLVKGVYEIIVKASMDQLRAYADLVSQVSKDLKDYQADMIGADDSEERKAKIESYIQDVLGLDPKTEEYTLPLEKVDELKTHFNGILVDEDGKDFSKVVTDNKLTLSNLEKFVTQKLKAGVKNSQDLLKTILKIGMQKVVVTNGEIMTKLTFHVDASDMSSKDSQKSNEKASGWGAGGGLSASGRLAGFAIGGSLSGGYSSRKVSVSVVNQKSSSATNIQIDILGQVRINFRTETFPTIDA